MSVSTYFHNLKKKKELKIRTNEPEDSSTQIIQSEEKGEKRRKVFRSVGYHQMYQQTYYENPRRIERKEQKEYI